MRDFDTFVIEKGPRRKFETSLISRLYIGGTGSASNLVGDTGSGSIHVTISSYASANMVALQAKLDAMSHLQDGWNGYSAPAPSSIAIENARRFVRILDNRNRQVSRIAPSAVGGVALTERKKTRRIFVEFYNDGQACVLFRTEGAPSRVESLETESRSYEALVRKAEGFLNG